MLDPTIGGQPVPLRRRSGPVTATVTGAELITPALRRVFLTCPELTNGAAVAPAAWVRGHFPDAGCGTAARAYTIVGFDAPTGRFALDFVLHGRGPAARWAAQAEAGQTLRLTGPLGRGRAEERHRRHVFAGDTTALPAIREWLAAIPPGAAAVVHLWAPDPEERQALDGPDVSVTWHFAGEPNLADLAEAGGLAPPDWRPDAPDVKFFIAGEAGLVTRARRAIAAAATPAPGNLHASGYWRLGHAGEPSA
jgi:NADPH-dependent ferric siderophore reductase